MSDDLVKRAAQAMMRAEPWSSFWSEADAENLAHAAIAVVLEEAAKVADAYEPRCDVCPRGVAAAIRAMIKEPQQ